MEEYEKPVIEIVYIDMIDTITASDNESEQIEITNNTTNTWSVEMYRNRKFLLVLSLALAVILLGIVATFVLKGRPSTTPAVPSDISSETMVTVISADGNGQTTYALSENLNTTRNCLLMRQFLFWSFRYQAVRLSLVPWPDM